MPEATKEATVAGRSGEAQIGDVRRWGRRRGVASGGLRLGTQRGLAHWLTLVIVLALSAIAAIAAAYYLRNRSYQQDVLAIEEHVQKARTASAGNVETALNELKAATQILERFDQSDPKRLELDGKIKQARGRVWESAKTKLKGLLAEGQLADAENFYKQASSIDEDGQLFKMLEGGRKEEKLVKQLRTDLQDAEALHKDRKMMDALKIIKTLYGKIENEKLVSKDVGDMRRKITDLRKLWIKEGEAQAKASFDKGNLAEAKSWYRFLADGYVGDTESRDYTQKASLIEQGNVIGLIVNVQNVRFADKKKVEEEIRKTLSERLEGRGLLPLNLSGKSDPRGAEVQTYLVVRYNEQPGARVQSPDKSRMANKTNIRCVLRIEKRGMTTPEDTRILRTETPDKIALGGAEFTDELLREKAARIFESVLKTVTLDNDKLKN